MWTPLGRSLEPSSLDGVVESYAAFLLVCAPNLASRFSVRRRDSPDAAMAEAVLFSWLRARDLEPEPFEEPGTGGPDFLCLDKSEGRFFVEVTTLDGASVERQSGWSGGPPTNGLWFSDITAKLRGTASSKARQLGGRNTPGVLAICCSHLSAGCLLGTAAAEQLMTSVPRITVSVGGAPDELTQETDLYHAAFVARRGEEVISVRRSISAVLLISIWEGELDVVGLLHPDPAVGFDYSAMEEVPFLRLGWPVVAGELRMEWVVGRPRPRKFPLLAVQMSEAELRGEGLGGHR